MTTYTLPTHRRWRLTATGIMGDRKQMYRCTRPHPPKTQTHTASRLSQLTCGLCVHGSIAGRIVLAQWQIGLKPSGATSTRSLSLFSWPVSGSLCVSLSLSASGFVVFLSQLRFSMRCPHMGSGWDGSHPQDSHVILSWDKLLLLLNHLGVLQLIKHGVPCNKVLQNMIGLSALLGEPVCLVFLSLPFHTT